MSTVPEAAQTEWMKASVWLRRHPGVFGKDTFYARIKDKSIPSVVVGPRKILVPDDLLDRIYEAGQQDA